MPYFSLDHCIVYASLLITLIVGLWAGRGIKTIREYAIADKMYGTAVLVCTYLATNLAGSFVLSYSGRIFSYGIIPILSLMGFSISTITFGLFIAPKAIYFSDCLTIGDLMKRLYGQYSGIIAGVLCLLQAVFVTGMELIALGLICECFLGCKPIWGVIIGGSIMAAYSAHGGIKSVVTTDVLQFLTLVVGIPMIAYIAVHRAGGIQELLIQIPMEKLAVVSHKDFYYYLICFFVWAIFPIGMIDPAVIQRMLMGRNPHQLRNKYLVSSTCELIFKVIILLIGLAGLILYPTTTSDSSILHIIHNLLPIGIKGCTIAGLLSLIMSTADSYLHVAGLTAVHDIIKPLCDQRGIILSSEKEKKWAQIATLGVGAVAIGIGLCTTDMFGLLLDSLEATGPILLFPLLTGILGLKPEKKAFIPLWGSQ